MKRIDILQQIFSRFQHALQWVTSNPETYVSSLNKAESLIELLEISDCGSVGGFDKTNKNQKISGVKTYDRFMTLVRKENKYTDLKDECGFTVESLSELFKLINNARNSF